MSTPKPRIDKAESRRIRVEIRRVLLTVWDPIGVKDEPYAQDEYDGYLGEIYELLTSGASDKDIEGYLFWATHDRMGMSETASKSHNPATIEALRKISIPPALG